MENKKKKKFGFEIILTNRKLKNIESEDIMDSILTKLKEKLSPNSLKLILKTQELISKKLCDNYNYTKDDDLLIREGLRLYCSTLTIQERRLIERFEDANNIKTVWRDKSELSNMRGQHFKVKMDE